MNARKAFQLDKSNGKVMGVCAGLSNLTGIDATIVRIAVVLATIVGGFPWTVIAYFVAAWAAKAKAPRLDGARGFRGRMSTHDVRASMRDIDRRMAEVECYVTQPNSRLAREIEELR